MIVTKPVRVLVTALNGDLGQAILKSLRLSERSIELVGADIRPGIGQIYVDEFVVLPAAYPSAPYIANIDRVCVDLGIDLVIPGCEPEQRSLAESPGFPELPCGVRVVSQSAKVLARCGDKLACYRDLEEIVPLADFVDGSDRDEVDSFLRRNEFPVCLKERVSAGARGVHVVDRRESFEAALAGMEKPVLQAFIDGPEQEYSVGAFVHRGETRTLAFRRLLEGQSCSWYAELDQRSDVTEYSRRVAEAFGTDGSLNIQLRIDKGRPLLLEVNPRFSSLAAARAECGFNDVEWSLLAALGEPVPEMPVMPSEFRYQRYLSEAVDRGSGWQVPQSWAPLSTKD